MRKNHVVVIGSGFGGVITARILNRLGALVTLVDAARHPRFAIGESSTPIADQLLRLIGSRYGFEDLVSMSCYGRWKSASPDVTCGKKRGFSYFDHRATRNTNRGATTEGFEGERSLLVAASPTDDASDTHWFRQEVDQALVTEACREGVELLEETRVTDLSRRADNCLDVKLSAGTNIVADFVVDASGNATTASLLQQPDLTHRLRTRTKTAYSHFSNVESFSSYFDSIHDDRRATWPFDADDAAQHHLIDEGWVWMLRLENGITSVGATSANHSVSADQLASLLESRFASCEGLSLILRGAKIAEYPGRIFRVPGIQRLFHPVVNQRCVMLPTAACTLDPLHSTGIAHALSGAIRIGEWFEQGCQKEALRDYGDCVVSEALHLDRMVSLAYRAMKGSFPLFAASCMVYFAAAIACEEGLIGGDYPRGYWLSDDADFREAVLQCERSLDLSAIPGLTEEQRIERVQSVLAPWNSAGLFESASNRYAYTATKVS